MNELVKYNDDMNKIKFTGLTKTHMDFLMAICAKVKSRGTDEIRIKTQEIKDLVHFERGGKRDFFEELKEMTYQLQKINGSIVDRTQGKGHRKFVNFVLFPVFEYDESEEWLTVRVNDRFAHLLNEFERYTSFELAEFVELKSKYAKNLYRFLKKWRGQGKYEVHNIEEFRETLDVPASYSNKYMMERCVNPSIEEIAKLDKSFEDFKCKVEYARKRGQPLEKIIFTWKPERNTFVDWNADQVEGQMSFIDNESFDKLAENCKPASKNKPKNEFLNYTQRTYTPEQMLEMERELLKKGRGEK